MAELLDTPARQVLCLHGARSGGAQLRMQLRPLFAASMNKGLNLEFQCPDGPLESGGTRSQVKSVANGELASQAYQAYPGELATELYPAPPSPTRGAYVKLPACCDGLRSYYSLDNETYEGVLGFGEGAEVAAVLLAQAEAAGRPPPFKWAVLFGGQAFGWERTLIEQRIDTPAFIARGGDDDEADTAFCELFEQVDVASMNDARQPFHLDDAAAATALASRVAAFVQRFDDGYASRQTTPYVSNYRPLVPTATREAHERSAEPGCCYGARTSAG